MNHKSEPNFDAEIKKELKELKSNIEDLKESYLRQLSHMANKVPDAIHKGEEKVQEKIVEHPFSSVGIAVAVGCVLGALFMGKK